MRRLNPFRSLRGKMTLTYTAVTGGVFLLLWLGLMGLVFSLNSATAGSPASEPLFNIVADETAAYLSQSPIDQSGLQIYLDLWVSGDTIRMENDSGTITASYSDLRFITVTDLAGEVLAVEPQALSLSPIALQIPPDIEAARQIVVETGQPQFGVQSTFDDDAVMYQIVPIRHQSELLGVLIMANGLGSVDREFEDVLPPIAAAFSVMILCGSLFVGTFFGWLASRGLVRRLSRLETAASGWASGDFGQTVADKSRDEIGQLGRNLNRMAEQLNNLLATETALATVEERNRLARDLHDTAKQQLFAANMQLASARAVLAQDPAHADVLLAEVEALTDQIQEELTTLIQALRPAALQDQGLGEALRQTVADWSRRLEIGAEVAIKQERPLPIKIEQALYRVLQEALANVAKHARASQVTVQLEYQSQTVTLRVRDNGVGFTADGSNQGIGLHSMNERLAALNGLVTVDSLPGRGTEVTAVVESPNDG